MRAPMPLIVRGGLSRTFGSLAGFTPLSLLSMGGYLLADAFSHPLDAEAAAVIVAAFAIAVSMLLFVFIFKPQRFPEMPCRKKCSPITLQKGKPAARLLPTARRERMRSDLPYQRTFVDTSRIRPQTPAAVTRAESPANSSLRESSDGEFDALRL